MQVQVGVLTAWLVTLRTVGAAQTGLSQISCGGKSFGLLPTTFKERPDLPSPYRAEDELDLTRSITDGRLGKPRFLGDAGIVEDLA